MHSAPEQGGKTSLLKQFPFSSSSTTSLLHRSVSFPLTAVLEQRSRWNPVNSIQRHLQDRKDGSLTASLWPTDSKISEENDNVQGGTVLCKHHLDIDCCETAAFGALGNLMGTSG